MEKNFENSEVKWIIGAYAALSSSETADWLDRETDLGIGLECPIDWVKESLNRPIGITLLPDLMKKIEKDPDYGLASPKALKRQKAISDFNLGLDLAIENSAGFIEIHSGPSRCADPSAFLDSLVQIAEVLKVKSRKVPGPLPEVLIEHCDAFFPNQNYSKGFLKLDDEISAIKKSGFSFKIMINWGRSALEGRSADTPLQHLKRAADSGMLGGIMFSGVCSQSERYGSFQDSHAPFGEGFRGQFATIPESLLSLTHARQCYEFAKKSGAKWFGCKVQALPKTLSFEDRTHLITECVEALETLSKSV